MSSCITKTDEKITTTQISLQIEEFFSNGGHIYQAKHGESSQDTSLFKNISAKTPKHILFLIIFFFFVCARKSDQLALK